jgi:hypothetical protein
MRHLRALPALFSNCPRQSQVRFIHMRNLRCCRDVRSPANPRLTDADMRLSELAGGPDVVDAITLGRLTKWGKAHISHRRGGSMSY